MTLALATVDDLRNAIQDATFDAGFAQSAIDRASSLVRSIARQQFDFVPNDVVELKGGGHTLVLPERPVVVDEHHPLVVEEIAAMGMVTPSIEGVMWYRQDDRLIRPWYSQWNPSMQFRWAGFYGPVRPVGIWGPRIRVTYTHGYAVAPEWLTTIVTDTAVKLATNPQNLRTEQVGGISLTWASESIRTPRDITDDIRHALKAVGIRRGGAFSVSQT